MRRNKFNLSHYHLTTFDMGKLVPVGCVEVLPGDTFQHRTSALVRVIPQLKPVMHPIQVRIHSFYVPNRILWSGWEDFITGESAEPPPVGFGSHGSQQLYAYLGQKWVNNATKAMSLLPLRAYNKIFNEYYRDQDLVAEVDQDSLTIQNIAWEKDYFTAARPWPQKGDAVTIPIGDTAPVAADVADNTAVSIMANSGNRVLERNTISDVVQAGDTAGAPGDGLYADLSSASAVDVRDFREAFALQRYQEARSRYGSNYVDYLRYCGIRPSDARLQRPEYLGGGRQTISFSEVVNTSAVDSADLTGHGIAAVRSARYRRFFEEHGWVITLMSVRPHALYVDGQQKKFIRTTKEDYYQKELEHIGQQEVYNKEVYENHTDGDGVFGYTDRYREYREERSYVSGEMQTSTSNDWHLGREYASDPALNSSFTDCVPTKRVFAEQTQDSLQVMVNHSLVARRKVSRNAQGRIL